MKLLIVSDIHGNWAALEAVLRAEPDCQAVAFCGDVVDYGPQPVECIRWLADRVEFLVRGNHDNALAFDQDCRCLGSFREFSLATRAWHRTLVGQPERHFLRGLPSLTWFEYQGRHFRMAHATPEGGLFEYLSMDAWGQHAAQWDADFVLLGHTHVQGMRRFGHVTVVNPGSVGLARDSPGEACYAIYEHGAMQLRRCPYDIDRTVAALRSAPLPQAVVEGLAKVLGASNKAPEGIPKP